MQHYHRLQSVARHFLVRKVVPAIALLALPPPHDGKYEKSAPKANEHLFNLMVG